MITDLVQIRRLGEKKRPQNERFRVYLKSHDYSDGALRKIAEEIEEQIDCTQCANCCRVATVETSERDIQRLARHLQITPARFRDQYTMKDMFGDLSLRWTKEHGCVFLEGNHCSVYEVRPDTCKGFPHLVRGSSSIAARMLQFIDRSIYCPIVYNSMEAFKKHLGFTR
ncbi:MAG TPA: YkgJ family cysteine cluster protein [Bryobacteraceae bacterium]|nr:YkgJ family cysteine cluster protein [Bryobacteraceae bacterium]